MNDFNAQINSEIYKRLVEISDLKNSAETAKYRSLRAEELARISEMESKITRKQVKAALEAGDQLEEVKMLRVDPLTGEKFDTAADMFAAYQRRTKEKIDKMQAQILREVHVDDYGAVPDGVTDSTEAFKKALGNGNVKVHMSAGTYRVNGIQMPSNSILIGQGIGVTTIKLLDNAPVDSYVVTNADHVSGESQNIHLYDFTADWNASRYPEEGRPSAAGGYKSSGIVFAGAKFSSAVRVEAKDCLLHCFDVTAGNAEQVYFYDGDKVMDVNPQSKNPSEYIMLTDCIADGHGDDGFTTHHCNYVFIQGCFSTGATNYLDIGHKNSNGFEMDDGSRFVFVSRCVSKENTRGFEVKGHDYSLAGANIHFTDCIDIGSVIAFNFRHMGHYGSEGQEPSLSAKDINVSNCVSLFPQKRSWGGDTDPRALFVSSYMGVNIQGFEAIGNDKFDGEFVIEFARESGQYNLSNVIVRGFTKATYDLMVRGGGRRVDSVNVSNFIARDSAKNGIYVGGSGLENAHLVNIQLHGRNVADSVGITLANNQTSVLLAYADRYAKAGSIAGELINDFPNLLRQNTKISSGAGIPRGSNTSLISTSGGATTTEDGFNNVGIGSSGGPHVSGSNSFVLGTSQGSRATGDRSGVIGSQNSRAQGTASLVLASGSVLNNENYCISMGAGNGDPSTRNAKIKMYTAQGNLRYTGTSEGGSTFSDYAEYFESHDGQKIDTGYLVSLVGNKIKKADKGEEIIGAISETAGTVLGSAAFAWQDRYLKNEFGGYIYEKKVLKEYDLDEEGNQLDTYKEVLVDMPKENPEYDASRDYKPRAERDEWHVVGITGQVHVRIDDTVEVGDKISAVDGIATKDESGQFITMNITTPYNADKGYGVAVVFIR